MRLRDVLEVSMNKVDIYEFGFNENGHIKRSTCIYSGYCFEALRDLTNDLNKKVCGIFADNDKLYISIYNAVDTEFLEK